MITLFYRIKRLIKKNKIEKESTAKYSRILSNAITMQAFTQDGKKVFI